MTDELLEKVGYLFSKCDCFGENRWCGAYRLNGTALVWSGYLWEDFRSGKIISFEDVLDNADPEMQAQPLFHLDIFTGDAK